MKRNHICVPYLGLHMYRNPSCISSASVLIKQVDAEKLAKLKEISKKKKAVAIRKAESASRKTGGRSGAAECH